jgi:hypothetical protein
MGKPKETLLVLALSHRLVPVAAGLPESKALLGSVRRG